MTLYPRGEGISGVPSPQRGEGEGGLAKRSSIPIAVTTAVRIMCVHRQPVVDMAAIIETTPIAKAVFLDNGMRAVHEWHRLSPTALIEIAGRARIVARIRNVSAMREAAHMPGLIARCNEIRDHRLEALGQMACHGDRTRRRRYRYDAAALRPGPMPPGLPDMRFPMPVAARGTAMNGAPGVMIRLGRVAMMVMTMRGLRWK